jgi:two-component system NtrC family sensor kinase
MPDETHTHFLLSSMQRTIRSLSSTMQEEDLIRILLDHLVSVFPIGKALVLLLNPDGDRFSLGGAAGLSKAYLSMLPLTIHGNPVYEQFLSGGSVLIDDLERTPEFPDTVSLTEGLRGMIGVPVKIRDRVVGAIHLYYPHVIGKEGPEDMATLEMFADLGALVLEKVRLHCGLYGIAEALHGSLELEQMLNTVLEATVKEMWLKGASIRLLDRKSGILSFASTHGLSEDYTKNKEDIRLTDSEIDRQALRGEVVIIHDVEPESRFGNLEDLAREGIRSILAVPLTLKDRTLGVIHVYSTRPRYFGPVGVTFLASVADLVSLAIENARLYATLEKRYKDLKLDLADWHRFLTLG